MWKRTINLKLFFLLLESVFYAVQSVQYGPSLDFLVSPARGNRKEIHLDGFYPTLSVTIPLVNGSATSHVGNVRSQGEFSILAPENYGIMVVIQSLKLRTKMTPSVDTYIKCRDFLRFTAGNETSQVCGTVIKYSKEANPSHLLGQRMFLTKESQLTVAFFVDTDLDRNDYGWHETLNAEVVVTAFKQCPKQNLVSSAWKKITGKKVWRSCSPSEDKVCVHPDTLCDGVSNCGVKGPLGHIGYDEEICNPRQAQPPPTSSPFRPEPPGPMLTNPPTTKTSYIGVNKPYTPPSTGKVISPIHLILIFSLVVLLVFGACTWLAKANEKKFQHTVYRFSTMRRNRRNNQRGRAAAREQLEEETINRRPSAPPPSAPNTLRGLGDIEALEIPGEQPPAYDNLFPSAPPLTATSTLSSS